MDVVAVCGALGLDADARPQPHGLMIRCPWHADVGPSCSVTLGPNGNLRAHCFACGKGGDVFSLIARAADLDVQRDFPRVLAKAQALLDQTSEGEDSPAARAEPPARLDDARFDTLARSVLSLARLRSFTPGSDYLQGRGLLDEAIADGWGCLPSRPAEQQRTLGPILARPESGWRESGLFKPDGSLRFCRNVLVIPWRAPDGGILTLQRRVLAEGLDRHKYVFPSGRAPSAPYGAERLAGARGDAPVAYVEGAVDVLAYRALCVRAGFERIVLGLPGAAGWRREWAEYAAGRTALVALDADAAGEAAVDRLRADLIRAGAREVLRKRPVGAKDWAAVLRARLP